MNITPVRIYINGNGSISFYGPNNTLITNLQNLNGAKQSNGQIIFDGDDKTISFYVYQLTSIESATFALTYSALDSRFFNPSVYSAKLNSVYQDVAEYVLVNKNGGASFVGGVVAVYPNYASFPATGQEAVIYIDEGTNQAYFWDGTSYQLLVSTGVQQYANFALFPVTGSANVIYIDMSSLEPYVWDGAAYVSLTDSATVAWGNITGVLSDQTDLQAALDAKFDDPTGTTAEYIRGDGTLATFPSIPSIAGLVPETRTLTINGTTQDLSANRTWSVGDMLKSVYDTDVDGVVDSAERIQIVVRNSTGSTLTKGQIVYLSGATGNRPNAVLAQANTEATSSKTIGMVIADIANNADGQVAVNGTLHDLDTSSFTAGDTLWLSATTAGGMVANTPPAEPNHAVFIGYVARSHPNLGRIVLAIQNGYELDELHGVQITTPTNWQVLRYNSSSGLWVNELISASILPGGIDASKIGAGTVDNTEFGYLDGVTSSIQSQLDSKFILPSLTSGSVLFSNGTTIAQNNSNLFWDNTNNRFSVRSAGEASRGICQEDYSTSQGAAAIVFQKARGTFASPLDVNANDLVGACVFNARVGGAFTSNRALFGANMQTSTGMGMYFIAGATNNNYIPDLYIHQSGNILIGTTESVLTGITDAGFKLDVNGITMLRGIVYGVGSGGGAIQLLTTAGTGTAVIGGNTGTPLRVQGQNLQLLVGSTQVGLFHATTGNLLLQNGGTFTDAGYRLDVNGTARVQGQLNSQSIVPLADSTYNLGTSALRFNFLYLRGLSTTGNSLDINAGNINLNNDVGAIKARLIGATGNFLIGTTTDAGFRLDVNGTARVQGNAQFGTGFYWDNANNRIGINTASPSQRLTVIGVASTAPTNSTWISSGSPIGSFYGEGAIGNMDFFIGGASSTALSRPVLVGRKSGGTLAVPTALAVGDSVFSFLSSGYSGTQFLNTASINMLVDGVVSSTSVPQAITFETGTTSRSERMRIASSGNLLVGTTTDAGFRLDVNGTARIQNQLTTTGSISAASAVARGTYLNQTLVATANNDTLYGLDIFPTFNTGSFTGVNSVAMRIRNASGNIFYLDSVGNATLGASLGVGSIYSSTNMNFSSGSGDLRLQSNFNANTGLTMFRNTRNFVIQDGGTFTDAGYRLDVQGTSRFTGAATFNNNMAIGGTLAVGTFTTAVASAQLEVVSTTKGFLPPRGTNAQMLAIASPAAGLIFYDTTNNKLNCYDGTTWQPCW